MQRNKNRATNRCERNRRKNLQLKAIQEQMENPSKERNISWLPEMKIYMQFLEQAKKAEAEKETKKVETI